MNKHLNACTESWCSYCESKRRARPRPSFGPSSLAWTADVALSLGCSTSGILKMSSMTRRRVTNERFCSWKILRRQQLNWGSDFSVVRCINHYQSGSCLTYVTLIATSIEINCLNTVVYFEMWKAPRYSPHCKTNCTSNYLPHLFQSEMQRKCIWPPNVSLIFLTLSRLAYSHQC